MIPKILSTPRHASHSPTPEFFGLRPFLFAILSFFYEPICALFCFVFTPSKISSLSYLPSPSQNSVQTPITHVEKTDSSPSLSLSASSASSSLPSPAPPPPLLLTKPFVLPEHSIQAPLFDILYRAYNDTAQPPSFSDLFPQISVPVVSFIKTDSTLNLSFLFNQSFLKALTSSLPDSAFNICINGRLMTLEIIMDKLPTAPTRIVFPSVTSGSPFTTPFSSPVSSPMSGLPTATLAPTDTGHSLSSSSSRSNSAFSPKGRG